MKWGIMVFLHKAAGGNSGEKGLFSTFLPRKDALKLVSQAFVIWLLQFTLRGVTFEDYPETSLYGKCIAHWLIRQYLVLGCKAAKLLKLLGELHQSLICFWVQFKVLAQTLGILRDWLCYWTFPCVKFQWNSREQLKSILPEGL